MNEMSNDMSKAVNTEPDLMDDLISRKTLINEILSLRMSIGGKDVFPPIVKQTILQIIDEQPSAIFKP